MTEADLPDIATLEIGGSRGATDWIEWNLSNYAEHGFGLWIDRDDCGEFVGDCGLTMQEVEGEWLVEAGWHVSRSLRRQGYAAEAAERRPRGRHRCRHRAPDRHHPSLQRGVPGRGEKVGLALEREVHKSAARRRWQFGLRASVLTSVPVIRSRSEAPLSGRQFADN